MTLAKFNRFIVRVLLAIGAVAIIAMMGIIVGNVIGRIFFNSPIYGAVEICGLTGVVVVAMAAGFTQQERRNVIVDVAASRFPPRIRAIADAFTLFLSLGIVAVLSWAMFASALRAAITGEYTPILAVTPAPFEFTWAIGTLILCFFLVQHMIEAAIKGVKK
jgi:TRAP-type C4-dicarboxylate transport system permease small subunit